MSESPHMVGGPVVGFLVGILAVVFFVLGALSWALCGHGYSLVYFGIGFVLVGAGLAVSGMLPPAFALFILFVILVALGLVIANGAGAGCGL